MSRVYASLHREPLNATPRKRLTKAQRAEILERQHDNCAGCGASLIWLTLDNGTIGYGPMIDEHILPVDLGGSNDLSNRELRCVPCARAKTREDRKRIDKARRLRRTEAGDVRPKRKIVGPGFDKTKSRGFDGRVRARSEPR